MDKFKKDIKEMVDLETALVESFHSEDKGVIGYIIAPNQKLHMELMKRVESNALWNLGFDLETVQYLQSTTPEERAELKRLSLIAFHTKEIERLQSK